MSLHARRFAVLASAWEGIALVASALQLAGVLPLDEGRARLLLGAAHSLLVIAAAVLVGRGRTAGLALGAAVLPVGFLAEASRLLSPEPGQRAAFGLALFVYGGLLHLLARPEVLEACGVEPAPGWPRAATRPLPYVGIAVVVLSFARG